MKRRIPEGALSAERTPENLPAPARLVPAKLPAAAPRRPSRFARLMKWLGVE